MADELLGNDQLTPDKIAEIREILVVGYDRVADAQPDALNEHSAALIKALDEKTSPEAPLQALLRLDDKWKEFGIESGILPPEGPGPAFACGGACIFGLGVLAGIIIEKAT
ncbi:hypothetical protein [Salipiger thiooxidans]|uniref:hypothetical protein n=1 Tax=Salipiger thiooxidans TaxID=282683 RepID=UPI001CFA6190|nr:hypothetical protein [Salipiger thiooxidans]